MEQTAARPAEVLSRMRQAMQAHAFSVDPGQMDWAALHDLLVGKRDFLVRLLRLRRLEHVRLVVMKCDAKNQHGDVALQADGKILVAARGA